MRTAYFLTSIHKPRITRLCTVLKTRQFTVMAPVELHTSPSVIPAVVFGAHGFWSAWLSVICLSTIYESYVSLPPSSAIRDRQPRRRRHAVTFSLLALTGVVVASFHGKQFVNLSYGVWATERGIELPQSLFGDKGAFRGGEHPGRMHLVTWLNDTPFYRDGLEVVAEKARYFWWGQQINLSLVPWSLYLAIEGRRRKIPHLWSFLALAQLVNLSYAQNLFFLAVLLTPVPLTDSVADFVRGSPAISRRVFSKIVPAKPAGFLPKPAFYILLLLSSFAAISLVPFASNTPSFVTVSLLARGLPFSFLALPYIIPESWGTVQVDPHAPHHTYSTLFRTAATLSALLHFKSTALALFFNTPESHYYRHSLLHPFKEEHRSPMSRGYTAVHRLVGAIGEHPTVAAAGWDVILSGFSVGLWAALRGLDAEEILGSSTPFVKRAEREVEDVASDVKEKLIHSTKATESSTQTRRRGRLTKQEDASEDDGTASLAVPKKRGRKPKKAVANGDDTSDASYQPSGAEPIVEGDEDVDNDWESSALSWGLMAVSGLATASAGVLGAEVLAR